MKNDVRVCPACGRAMIAVSYSSSDGTTTYQCKNRLCDFSEDVKEGEA